MTTPTETALATQEKTPAPLQGGTFLPAGVPALYAMPKDEQEELEDYAVRLLIIQFNGQDGHFKNVETKEVYPQLNGVLLGVVDGQVLFAPDIKFHPDEKRWAWPKWICRNSNSKKGRPVLNSTLTEEQRAEALRRGAGSNCATCPLRQFDGDKSPLCDKKAQLVWFDDNLRMTCLVPAGGKSLKPISRYVGSFKRDNVSMYSYHSHLAPEQAEDGAQKYYILHIDRGELVHQDHFLGYRQLRQTIMAALDYHLDNSDRIIDANVETRPVAEPSGTSAGRPAPAATREAPSRAGRGIVLTEDGEVVADADPFPEFDQQAALEEVAPAPSDDDYVPSARKLPF